jgi:rare lipoprotein A
VASSCKAIRRAVPTGRALGGGVLVLAVLAAGCASRAPVSTAGARAGAALDVSEGLASYYGPGFHGKTTASGAPFDMNAMVAAHPSYPFGTEVRVTNLGNGRSVRVTILDRGPARRHQADGVIIDVSRGAAERLGFVRDGRVRVRVEVLVFGEPDRKR